MSLPSTSLGSTLQVVGQDLYTSSSTQSHVLGSYAETPDGRGFRYCKNGGTAMVPGKLYQAPAEDTTNFQNLTVAVNSVGDTTVTTTTGAIVSQGNDTHDQEVGYALTGIASTDYGLIFATID